ncbi:MAG: hypothetical protein FWC01_08040 [Treponema sp.]|nr:hypothetical protein [Treponema sp.]MCL2237876.1 hypothetical protein [Treponema sp.]
MKKIFLLLIILPVFAFADSMYSPTWGFHIDLPEGYEFTDGDARDRFSFAGPQGLLFDLLIYQSGRYGSVLELTNDINRRLSNRGDVDLFRYRDKQAAVIKLTFGEYDGWALAIELAGENAQQAQKPILLALAYAPANRRDLEIFHISALDSIRPTTLDLRYPGPLIEYSYPRGDARNTPLALRGLNAMIYQNDAEASQVLVEREFNILTNYLNTPLLQDACIRYYRFIFRDSYDRIAGAATVIANHLGASQAVTAEQKTAFAQRVLTFVQGFNYERDLSGSDFVNLVSAITEGRGDCDSRAMLFAVMLSNADIRGAIMLSHHYSHAMGLADVPGQGARFDALGTQWLVAETTANINIGLIDQTQADPQHWFAVVFE